MKIILEGGPRSGRELDINPKYALIEILEYRNQYGGESAFYRRTESVDAEDNPIFRYEEK